MASQVEVAAMRAAVDAAGATPRTLPNPRVGCVLLDPHGGRVAVAAHQGAGSPHAEVAALQRAGSRAEGGTAVVTLEPCVHTGRTGPCVQALLAAGIVRVVVGQCDPNPLAAGGAAALRSAGVEVETGVLEEEARALNAAWAFAMSRGRPFVTWKAAATLDGRSAAADGTSQWITGAAARADVQRLRAEADAIVVGTGTARADDPRLTLRASDGTPLGYDRQPLRVVVGEHPVPSDARVRDAAAPFVQYASHDIEAVLGQLAERQVRHVWLEGGPTLAGAFVAAHLVDEVVAYLAPALLGAGTPMLLTAGMPTIADIRRLRLDDVSQVGDDVRVIARPHTPGG